MSNRPDTCRADLRNVVVATICRTALWTAVFLQLWAVMPALFGWQVTTVASGSMEPRIMTGDVVVAAPVDPDSFGPGRVLLVADPDHDARLRLHRLVRTEDDGSLRLRGDANGAEDASTVEPAEVRGVGVIRVPWIGLPGMWLGQGEWLALGALVVGAGVLLAGTTLDRDVRTARACRRCGAPRWDERAAVPGGTGAAGTQQAAVVILVSAMLIGVAGTADGAGATFSSATDTAAALGTGDFPCFDDPLLDSPVLAWDFAEPGGTTVRDRSGRGADGDLVGGASRVNGSCAADPSAALRSLDAEGWIPSRRVEPAPNRFTAEVWFRTVERASGRVFGFSSGSTASSTYRDRHLYIGTDGKLWYGLHEAGTDFKFTLTSIRSVADGQWHHAAAVFEPGHMELWLDGVQQGQRTDTRNLVQYSGSWRAGRDSLSGWPFGNTADFSLNGSVDTARVYDSVLSGAQIAAHAAAGR